MNPPTCESYLVGKIARKPFGKAIKVENPLQLIHSDICSPMNVRARNGGVYFITFIDDYTHFGFIYLISHNAKALECFKRYLNLGVASICLNNLNCCVMKKELRDN